jgi:predicted kinase
MPASGKSTLAAQLAAELGVPYFTKDDVKEVLFDAGGYREESMDESTSERFGAQAIALLFDITQRLIESGVSVVLEANFRANLTIAELEPIRPHATVRQVYCQVPVKEIVNRFEARQDGDERHPVHAGIDDVDQLVNDLQHKDYGPIPDLPTLIVDTSDGFDPPVPDIAVFCRAGTLASS